MKEIVFSRRGKFESKHHAPRNNNGDNKFNIEANIPANNEHEENAPTRL